MKSLNLGRLLEGFESYLSLNFMDDNLTKILVCFSSFLPLEFKKLLLSLKKEEIHLFS